MPPSLMSQRSAGSVTPITSAASSNGSSAHRLLLGVGRNSAQTGLSEGPPIVRIETNVLCVLRICAQIFRSRRVNPLGLAEPTNAFRRSENMTAPSHSSSAVIRRQIGARSQRPQVCSALRIQSPGLYIDEQRDVLSNSGKSRYGSLAKHYASGRRGHGSAAGL